LQRVEPARGTGKTPKTTPTNVFKAPSRHKGDDEGKKQRFFEKKRAKNFAPLGRGR
jgi:hypothetical protein